MISTCVIVEEASVQSLYPFDVLHCAWELRSGPCRLIEAWKRFLNPPEWELIGRTQHVESFFARFPEYKTSQIAAGMVVVISSELFPTRALAEVITRTTHSGEEAKILIHDTCYAVVLSSATWDKLKERVLSFDDIRNAYFNGERLYLDNPLIKTITDTFDVIEQSIVEQIPQYAEPLNEADFRSAGVFTVSTENIYISEGCTISPMVVLDASKGPIIIDSHVTIMSHSTICGPCFIGSHSLIKIGSKIYPNTVIGEWCKVGGEIEHSIMHAYSNKQHEGFLGHSYISEWVNLGADTNTSDLKNTYGNITISQRGKSVPTNRMFVGLLCGDHSKSGINTMFNTGTVVGIHANIFGAGYTPTEISSYTWGGISEQRLYNTKMALSVAKTVMQRRAKQLLPEEETLMLQEFTLREAHM